MQVHFPQCLFLYLSVPGDWWNVFPLSLSLVYTADCAVSWRGGSGLWVRHGLSAPPAVPDPSGPTLRDPHQPCWGPLCPVPAVRAGPRGHPAAQPTVSSPLQPPLTLNKHNTVSPQHAGANKSAAHSATVVQLLCFHWFLLQLLDCCCCVDYVSVLFLRDNKGYLKWVPRDTTVVFCSGKILNFPEISCVYIINWCHFSPLLPNTAHFCP